MASYFKLELREVPSTPYSVKRYANKVYKNNDTMNKIYDVYDIETNEVIRTLERNFRNTFVGLAGVNGISMWEKILDILPDINEQTLEFRRSRVSKLLATMPPFTKIYLEQVMEAVFGKDKYFINIDYNNYKIELDIVTDIIELFEQTIQDLREIIPANMVIIATAITPYTHRYLNKYYTHEQMQQFTFGELSKYSNIVERN